MTQLISVVGAPIDTVSSNQDTAAGIWRERFSESEHDPLPGYVLVAPRHIPDPVLKLAGEFDREASVKVGEFSLVSPYFDGRWVVRSGAPFDSIKLAFSRRLVGKIAEQAFGAGSRKAALLDLHGRHDGFIQKVMLAIGDEVTLSDNGSKMFVDTAAQMLTLYLLRNFSTLSNPALKQFPNLHNSGLRRAVDYIEAHLGDDLCLERVAEIACLSSYHFLRAFKSSTGRTPHRYIQERRIERAKLLLSGSDLSLAQISFDCGFSSQSHFTTVFGKLMGTTPAKYRSEFNT